MAEAELQNHFANLEEFKAVKILNGTSADLTDVANMAIVKMDPSSLGGFTDDDVLIKVDAFALNPVDYKMNALFPEWPTEHIICSDACGTVCSAGENASFQKGDKVMLNSNLKFGVAAEYIVINKDLVAKTDDCMSIAEAAGLPLVSIIAFDAINALGDLKKGSRVMINGASGGTGTLVTQICSKVHGHHVIGICSGKNEDLVRGLGAAEVINYKEQDFAEYEAKIDGFVDCVGGIQAWNKAQGILKEGAIYATIVGDDPTLADNSASFARTADPEVNYKFVFYASNGDKLAQIAQMVKDGKIKPQTHATYPATEIHEAMKELKSKRAVGKIVLQWN